ncbi:helix-turn-helix transcriptional regulator [Shewanella sp. SM101]|jgi:hypothetical protein|uniref:helix-turn-helix domain-containing protein n=1 Tax=Shewanella TaxID=22 RepID=UPI0021DA2831|nr:MULTISPECIES: helix-turn-helix transcriptional regulator [unclassified Shewanella]MCU8008943.1 helix-turn-helix transcriptional regulator [Shewanella sp. SM87]MCU8106894.1 helix-turn-helix transcriptional regulator [Shewanella sp. SM101]
MIQFIRDNNNHAQFAIVPIHIYERLKDLINEEDSPLDDFLMNVKEEDADELDADMLSGIQPSGGEYTPHAVVKLIELDNMTPAAAWRTYRGFSQSEAAIALNIGQPTLSRMESRGANTRPASKRKMAQLYQCSIEQLA